MAGKPLDESVSLFTYMDQERLNFARQGNLALSPNGVKTRKFMNVKFYK